MSYSICYSSLRYKRMKKRLQKVIMVPRLVTRWSKVFLSTIAPLLKIERRRSKLACLVYLCILRFWNELLTQSRNQTTLLVTRVHHHFFKITYYYIALLFKKCVIITLILESRVSLLWKSWCSSGVTFKALFLTASNIDYLFYDQTLVKSSSEVGVNYGVNYGC